jgi:hypothetical protein
LVVEMAHSTLDGMPKRTSLPSIAAPATSVAGPFGCVSAHPATDSITAQISPITVTST